MYLNRCFSLLQIESNRFQSIGLLLPLADVASKFLADPELDDALDGLFVSAHPDATVSDQIECRAD